MEGRAEAVRESVHQLSGLIAGLVRFLVNQPEQVKVEVLEETESTTLRLSVDPEDVGYIVGKQGRTAQSLRVILGAASTKLKHRVSLDIAVGKRASAEIGEASHGI